MLSSPSLEKLFSFEILFIYFQGEGKGGRKSREKHQCVGASCVPSPWDLACNIGMCPNWELNQ